MAPPDLLEMAPSLHRLRVPGGPAHELNCYLWLEGRDVTLVDTGWPGSGPLVADALSALGLQREDVVRIVLTHFHADHAGGAAEIAAWGDVEVVAGRGDAAVVAGVRAGQAPHLTAREAELVGDVQAPPRVPPCRVDVEVQDGDVLPLGGGARVLALGGHTPGSIGLFLPDVDAVLTGDVVAEFHGQVIAGVFHTDRSAIPAALGRLADTGATVAGFGHGAVVLAGAARAIAAAGDPFA